jgi:hypothetical protein
MTPRRQIGAEGGERKRQPHPEIEPEHFRQQEAREQRQREEHLQQRVRRGALAAGAVRIPPGPLAAEDGVAQPAMLRPEVHRQVAKHEQG